MGLGKNFKLIWNGMLVDETVKRVAIEIVERGLKMIEIDAKRLCTWDYGDLRANIHGEMDKAKIEGRCGVDKEYGPYIEFGTGIHAEGGKGRKTPWVYYKKRDKTYWFTHGQKPQPYMRPAYEKNIKQIMGMFDAVFK